MFPVLIFLICCSGSREGPWKEYVYKTVGKTDLTAYVFQPSGRDYDQDLPVVILFHGGAWVGGHAWQFYPQCGYLAERGIVAITVEYRVRKRYKGTPYDCVEDAKSAVRWVRTHSEELGIDPGRIAVGGGSSGGHLAACTALVEGFNSAGEDTLVSARPDALVLFNPPLDVLELLPGLPAKLQRSLGGKVGEISPFQMVRPGMPPAIIFHGTEDSSIPFHQAERFAAEMERCGNRCDIVLYEARGHGFFNYEGGENPDFFSTMEDVIGFLAETGILDDYLN